MQRGPPGLAMGTGSSGGYAQTGGSAQPLQPERVAPELADLRKTLLLAAWNGDLAAHAGAGHELNSLSMAPNDRRLTPLGAAAYKGQADAVAWLLARGAEDDGGVYGGSTALDMAASAGHVEVARALLDAGADTYFGLFAAWHTALHVAAFRGHAGVARLLLERGVDVRGRVGGGPARVEYDWLPLHVAVGHGRVTVAQLLLENGADAMGRSARGELPLVIAIARGRFAAVKVLLDAGAAVDGRSRTSRLKPGLETDEIGQHALYCAAIHGHLGIVALLLERGAGGAGDDFGGASPWAAFVERSTVKPDRIANVLSALYAARTGFWLPPAGAEGAGGAPVPAAAREALRARPFDRDALRTLPFDRDALAALRERYLAPGAAAGEAAATSRGRALQGSPGTAAAAAAPLLDRCMAQGALPAAAASFVRDLAVVVDFGAPADKEAAAAELLFCLRVLDRLPGRAAAGAEAQGRVGAGRVLRPDMVAGVRKAPRRRSRPNAHNDAPADRARTPQRAPPKAPVCGPSAAPTTTRLPSPRLAARTRRAGGAMCKLITRH